MSNRRHSTPQECAPQLSIAPALLSYRASPWDQCEAIASGSRLEESSTCRHPSFMNWKRSPPLSSPSTFFFHSAHLFLFQARKLEKQRVVCWQIREAAEFGMPPQAPFFFFWGINHVGLFATEYKWSCLYKSILAVEVLYLLIGGANDWWDILEARMMFYLWSTSLFKWVSKSLHQPASQSEVSPHYYSCHTHLLLNLLWWGTLSQGYQPQVGDGYSWYQWLATSWQMPAMQIWLWFFLIN